MKLRHLATLVVAALLLFLFFWLRPQQPESHPGSPKPAGIATSIPTPHSIAAVAPTSAPSASSATPALESALVKRDIAPDVPLATRQESIEGDIEMMRTFLSEYRNVFGEDPVGTNAEITRALTGANNRQISFLNRQSPILNAEGEMIDRWGKPYFFHQISGQEMKIRSAGPDQKMWSKDDIEVE